MKGNENIQSCFPVPCASVTLCLALLSVPRDQEHVADALISLSVHVTVRHAVLNRTVRGESWHRAARGRDRVRLPEARLLHQNQRQL